MLKPFLHGWAIAFAFLVVGGVALRAEPPDTADDAFSAPSRWAFVVGISAYKTVGTLPNAIEESKMVAGVLEALNFNVTLAADLTRDDFVAKLEKFIETVEEDDFVVFYFAGHGFNYGNDNYLIPLSAPATVFDGQQRSEFIMVSDVARQIQEKKPGYLLLLLDACRTAITLPKILVPNENDAGTGVVNFTTSAGMAAWGDVPGGLEIGFATTPGKQVDANASGPGAYAKGLVHTLPTPNKSFEVVRGLLINWVLGHTKSEQNPSFYVGSGAEVHFKKLDDQYAQEKAAWESAKSAAEKAERANSRQYVEDFVRRYSISGFVRRAKQWLASFDGRLQTVSYTRIVGGAKSPEMAWVDVNRTKPSDSFKLRSVVGSPWAFTREFDEAKALAKETRTPPRAVDPTVKLSPTQVAEFITLQNEAVLTGPVTARQRPDTRAEAVAELMPGSRVSVVSGPLSDPRGQPWIGIRAPGMSRITYVAVPATTTTTTTDIGKPLSEVYVGRLPNGLQALADVKVATDAVGDLRKAGRIVAWVSIATPSGQAKDDEVLARIRAEHLVREFERSGLSAQRISILESAADLSGKDLRVRFFGN